MRGHKTFRIDKIFGLATLVCMLVLALMVYNDFFKPVSISTGTEKETQNETRTNNVINETEKACQKHNCMSGCCERRKRHGA